MAIRYGWNARAGRYVNLQTGQFVPDSDVRGALERALQVHAQQANTLALSLRNREISISDFSIGMRGLIKDSQLYSAMLAVGGREQMIPQLNGLAGAHIADQYAFLENFVGQLRSGLPMDGRFLVRAQLYVLNGWGTWSAFQARLQQVLGRTQYRNRLRPADHCTECVALAALGWVALGTLPPVGQRLCLVRCRCFFEYR